MEQISLTNSFFCCEEESTPGIIGSGPESGL